MMEVAGVLAGEGVRVEATDFQPAWWCRNAHLQTIWAGILRPAPRVPLVRARWELPDGDFLDVDELAAGESVPRLIVLHGLESSSRATTVLGILHQAHQRGWGGVAVNFRGCSGEPNRLRRSYHGGDTADLAWVIARVRGQHPASPIVCVGFSLGGNVLLKYLGEQGEALPEQVRAAVAVSAPVDLALSARALEHGFSRVYGSRLVAGLKRKTFQKLAAYPDLVDAGALKSVRTLGAFDDLVTGPVHGFKNAKDYWGKSSSASFLPRIRRPKQVTIVETFEGQRLICHGEQVLASRAIAPRPPATAPRVPWPSRHRAVVIPEADHPWRSESFLRSRRARELRQAQARGIALNHNHHKEDSSTLQKRGHF